MTLQQLRYAIMVADCNSINRAAKVLFLSQSSLSGAMKELEQEIGFEIFSRTNRGITITQKGKEFLGYARQVTEQYQLMEERYVNKKSMKESFSVSTQHYSFAVKAFVEMVKQFGMDKYEFAIHETRTFEVMEDVKQGNSEIGVLYLDAFNDEVLSRLLSDSNLEFYELFECKTYVYLWKEHPLAGLAVISLDDLKPFPCLSFDQGRNNSFYFAEEVLSTYDHQKIIKANDRATMLNLMVGLDGYTLCSGIICEELNGDIYAAVPLDSEEVMRIGYIKRKNAAITPIGEKYIGELIKYKENRL